MLLKVIYITESPLYSLDRTSFGLKFHTVLLCLTLFKVNEINQVARSKITLFHMADFRILSRHSMPIVGLAFESLARLLCESTLEILEQLISRSSFSG